MSTKSDFIEAAERLILEHVSDEQFGVSELAEAMNMSRSNLLRKIKKDTELSASQFIRKVRLQKAMELLRESDKRVSEVSYEVGFSSVSYFVKCFREDYGYPPGEVGQHDAVEEVEEVFEEPEATPEILETAIPKESISWRIIASVAVTAVLMAAVLWFFAADDDPIPALDIEKSIAVLPFKNESTDSANLYFVNGLMESTLSNLQKIEDLRVISRTSSEKYRNSGKSIPEIAEELNVSYIVEGSGQKVGDQVLLNIQLIEASGDRHIWAEQYNREVTDIFNLQNDIAREIATAIEAIVTPGELAIIAKPPTENVEAYDLYLQAMEPYHSRTPEGLQQAIPLFEEAVALDPEFALAYAGIAISYYFLDINQAEKQHTEKINSYSDKALLYDSKSDVCLVSKAFYYIQIKDYRLALPHLEKALEYNPNSHVALQMLSNFYAYQVPNTAKYLEYSLKGIQLNVVGDDSIARSYGYLQLSNALVQTGFLDESWEYVNKSLEYNPNNFFAPHLKVFVQYARDSNEQQALNRLIQVWKNDTTRLDILKDIGKLYYTQRKMDSAYYCFEKFLLAKKTYGLTMFNNEDLMIARVYKLQGLEAEAAELLESYKAYCDQDQTMYKHANMALLYAYENKMDRALEELELFSSQSDFQFWFLLLENDPLIEPIKDRPEFVKLMQKIKDRFWDDHNKLRDRFEEEGLL